MKIKYFKDIKDKEELRKAYLRLMKENHPDAGGDGEVCKVINSEYDYLFSRLPDKAAASKVKGKTRNTSKANEVKMDEAIRKVINSIIHMKGINIEIIGMWIWVDGNTYPWKEELKANGFEWSRTRKKWHYSPYEGGWHRGKNRSFETIRGLYGSTIIEEDDILSLVG